MTTVIIDHRHVSLDYEAECLLIRQTDQPLRSVPLTRLNRILVMHNVQISTRLIGHCQRLGIDFIAINSRHTEHSFALHARHLRQAHRRMQQYRLTSTAERALQLACRLVKHKLAVTRRLLRATAPETTSELDTQLGCQLVQIDTCLNMQSLRGHEGSAQRLLFSYWRHNLPVELGFQKRQRRPPPDPVNAVLSLSYTLMYQEAIRQCLIHGLDPWLGFYHQLAPGRQSLACDLMEPLRPLIEEWVVSLFNQAELDRRHFSQQGQNCLLGKHGRELYYTLWHAQLPHWSRRLGHYAQLLARHLDQLPATVDAEENHP